MPSMTLTEKILAHASHRAGVDGVSRQVEVVRKVVHNPRIRPNYRVLRLVTLIHH